MKYIAGIICAVVMLPAVAFAGTVYLDGHNIELGTTDVVEGDFYVSSGVFSQTDIAGTVQGDVYAWGGILKQTGTVEGDFGGLALSTTVSGTISDDLRLVSGDVVLENVYIAGDVFITAQHLHVTETATIEGNIYFFGVQAEIAGTVLGNVYGTYAAVEIDGVVHGSVDITSMTAPTIGPSGNIKGSMTYASSQSIVRAPSSVIEGNLEHVATSDQVSRFRDALLGLLVMVFSTLTLYLILHRNITVVAAATQNMYIRCFVVGLLLLLFTPSVIGLLLVSQLAMIIGVLMLLLFLMIMLVAVPMTIIITGAYAARWVTGAVVVHVWWILAGVGIFTAILLIPIIGPVIAGIIYIVTCGAIVSALYKALL